MFGEAEWKSSGLWIDDQEQGWQLKMGEISREMLMTNPFENDYDDFMRWQEDLQSAGPIFGLFFSKEF